jgi:organic radical activating enzyme
MKPIDCISLYKGLRITTSGEVCSCCMQKNPYLKKDGTPLNVVNETFSEIMNSDIAREIREAFERGERHKACDYCWVEEDSGIKSKRLRDLDFLIELTDDEDLFNKDIELKILDVNVSNVCNLKCRSCSMFSSSSWANEFIKLYPSINIIPALEGIKKIFEDDSLFWEEYKKSFHTIKHIDFYGGEPFLVKKQIETLQYVIDQGLSKDISIHFNTNCTIWDDDIFDILKDFKHVNVDLSIDGMGNKAHYIRYPSTWNNVYNNYQTIYESQKYLDHFRLSICCTISPFNIYYIDEILDTFNNQTNVYLNLVYNPLYYSIQYLPEVIKEEVERKIRPVLKKHKKDESILNFMYSKKFNEKIWKKFIEKTIDYDNHRNQKFSNTFPEFANLLKMYGFDYGKF